MKYYVQFYQYGVISEQDKLVRQLGSNGVYILDGRNSLDTMINDGFERVSKLLRKPDAFKIMKGNRFDDSIEKTDFIMI